MDVNDLTEWTLEGALDDIKRIHDAMRDRQFAFILGAGASVTSGIPTGQQLAQKWLRDLYLRECLDNRTIDQWIDASGLGDGDLKFDNAAEYYPQIFERRFEGDREAGYAELEVAMEGKAPSLGYSLLAEIIQHTRHKVVVTTNFDNLVADALAMHAHRSPLVVAHESLAGFVRPQMRRPLVAKIHRDLYLNPLNDTVGVSNLEQGWKTALKKLFQHFTPIVIGYGGNDGSLMNMLLELEPGDISGRIIWCYRTGSTPPQKAIDVLKKHKGILVEVTSFDQFMLRLAANLVTDFDVAAIAERTAQLGEVRAARYREQATELYESARQGSPADRKTSEVLKESMKPEGSWWAWKLKADNEPDNERRKEIYLAGIKNFPESSKLLGSYGLFLELKIKDYDAAEATYKKALLLNPYDVSSIVKYACFLSDKRGDIEGAHIYFEKARSIDPQDSTSLASYARFIAKHLKDIPRASETYQKAIEIDPSDYWARGMYGRFLEDTIGDIASAEKSYKTSAEMRPDNAWALTNYAVFLAKHDINLKEADIYFKKALSITPDDEWLIEQYELFKKRK
ncbi:SIR2 family protein [Pseudomonas viridiflava]|uniref:SIR2 family protein n=1 Tax=Pseudomonas viridiflava TaxID=33069 RepID=UPI000F03ABF0|nr:SIR2 family protein [Pseudomonas viridiflava]